MSHPLEGEGFVVPIRVGGGRSLGEVLVSHAVSRKTIHLCFNYTLSVLLGQEETRDDLRERRKGGREGGRGTGRSSSAGTITHTLHTRIYTAHTAPSISGRKLWTIVRGFDQILYAAAITPHWKILQS